MSRTQLYLDDSREAVRERYLGKHDEQRDAMRAFAGSGQERFADMSATKYVQELRRGNRLDRLKTE